MEPQLKPTCYRAKLIGIDKANPGDDKTVYTNIKTANVFADKANALTSSHEDMTVCNAVNRIVNLALLNRKILHINVAYTPEDAGLVVKVFQADANYFGQYKTLLRRGVYLDQPSSKLQLQTLENDLIELIGSAKDKLMGAV